ncbi:hypothetical protein [Dyadobacter sp. NIV53]|uniref:hypothetical protein n=1 Tax=Dyadobacter sp. NIV53 TaxID=2861765 RepID=UPI001C86F512|nr:hypothetical protein [Dyadobacter sp. NIV53]
MSKTRKEKVIEEIEKAIDEHERDLIDTPDDMSQETYQKLIELVKQLRETLEIVKKQ